MRDMILPRRHALAGLLALVAAACSPQRARGQGRPVAFGAEETLWQGDGLTVTASEIARAGAARKGRLLVAHMAPASFDTAIAENRPGVFAPAIGERWRVSINASYFDAEEQPIRLLEDRRNRYGAFRPGTSAVFVCAENGCRIIHASDYQEGQPVALAVQSTPRVLAGGAPTQGVRNPHRMDSRAGLAIARDGAVLAFATDRWAWSGLSFSEVAETMATRFSASEVLMLDGGSSTWLRAEAPDFLEETSGPGRSVPHFLSFIGRDAPGFTPPLPAERAG